VSLSYALKTERELVSAHVLFCTIQKPVLKRI
jgi:hypothetical protein